MAIRLLPVIRFARAGVGGAAFLAGRSLGFAGFMRAMKKAPALARQGL
jgi:hypothetical protein